MRVRSVNMGRVWVYILLYCSQRHYSHMITENQAQFLGGVGLRKKPKDLSVYEREESEHGEGRDVYPTLM